MSEQGLKLSAKSPELKDEDAKKALSIVVIGASGDLAKKKTYPALFSLYCHGLLPKNVIIAGYARRPITPEAFHAKISVKFSDKKESKAFLSRCFYHQGQYNSAEDFKALNTVLAAKEAKEVGQDGGNRIFYLAIPPSVFADAGKAFKTSCMSTSGWNRVVVEKPFGRDTKSSAELGAKLAALFREDQLYRIDHYLGKEMAQNLLVLRFSNMVFSPIWNNKYVSCVLLTFMEPFGTKGRGGYFDKYGIIRDIMQNHLLQLLSLVAMECPKTLSANDVRNEKVKLLKCIKPIVREDVVLGQYGADPRGSESSYLDDPTVPNDSVTPTYAQAVLHIDNDRWRGVPFIMKAGKALNKRKAEIRIQFKQPDNHLFDGQMSNNELVLRVQPNAAVYLKASTKTPGLSHGVTHAELNLDYQGRLVESVNDLPGAYERLIYDVIKGDQNHFVREDELDAAWKIFTPLLHQIDRERIQPELYAFGSRGPPSGDALVRRYGYVRTQNYHWSMSPRTNSF